MPRLFVPQEQLPVITGRDVHYLRDVLRLKVGDELELLDGTGTIHSAVITKIEKEKIICAIKATRPAETEPKVKVTLAQALPKASKMDFIIEKGVELGVYQILPMSTERTIAKSAKIERWRKLAKEAAEQSGRAIIPAILPPLTFAEVLKKRDQFDLALIPWELEKQTTLKKVFTGKSVNNLLILIGPEGGFSLKEIELAKATGFAPVSLGKRILRTETAGLAILAIIHHELG